MTLRKRINIMSREKPLKIHFIGIGGIGISALARLCLFGGKDWVVKNFADVLDARAVADADKILITGSDLTESEMILDLQKLGAKIVVGEHKKENLFISHAEIKGMVSSELASIASCSELKRIGFQSAEQFRTALLEQVRNSHLISVPDLIVYSAAVPKDNSELVEAKMLRIPCLSYSQAVGELTKKMYTIAVSGMHGKSTTTAMLALVLEKAGLDPTVIIGTKLKQWGGANARLGQSKYLVIEADEWQASFLNYWPKIIVLTNIEEEHLDYYKNLNHILKTFKEYVGHLPVDGYLIANADDENIKKILNLFLRNAAQKFLISNSKNYPPLSRLRRAGKLKTKNRIWFFLKQPEAKQLKRVLQIPGEHNISNALAVLSVARILDVKDEIIFRALAEFTGTWRRFEESVLEIRNYKLKIVSDYGHHPSEVKATLQAAKEKYPHKKIWVLFQPHQYQRTYYLFDRFVSAFDQADGLILMKIYDVAGREIKELKQKVSSAKLAQAIRERDQKRGVVRQVLTVDDLEQAKQLIEVNVIAMDILIVMGAGDIYKILDSKN